MDLGVILTLRLRSLKRRSRASERRCSMVLAEVSPDGLDSSEAIAGIEGLTERALLLALLPPLLPIALLLRPAPSPTRTTTWNSFSRIRVIIPTEDMPTWSQLNGYIYRVGIRHILFRLRTVIDFT